MNALIHASPYKKGNTVKRKVIIASAITLATLASAYIGGSYYAGKTVETTMQKQHEWLAQLPYFIVKSHTYQRGWFSSQETTTLQVNPELYRFALEREGEPLQTFELTYTNHIKHGPLPLLTQFTPIPYKAVVNTEFVFAEDTQKFIAKFFGEQKPIQVENRISFNDDGVVSMNIPRFEYEEALSGIKAQWQGLNATLAYGGDFNRVLLNANAPGLQGSAKSKGEFALKDFQLKIEQSRGQNGLMIGTTNAKLAQLDLHLTDGTPLKLKLENLAYLGDIKEVGEFINGSAKIDLAKIILDDQPYGPAVMIAEANHLHGKTLAKLGDELTLLQKKKMTREQLTEALSDMAKTHGLPLLQNDPQLAIKKLEIKLPEGAIRFSGEVGLKGFVVGDLDKPVDLVNKLAAKADFAVPRKVVETLVTWQARNMFAGADSQVNLADLDFLAGQFVEGQINKLAEQNLIRVEGSLLASTASLQKGQFILNGINVPLPWQAAAEQ